MRIISTIFLAFILLLSVVWFVGMQPLFVKPKSVDTPQVNADTLKSYVLTLSKTLPARVGKSTALQPTLKWIENQIKPYGISYRQSYQAQGENFHNVIMNFGPESEDLIIVGAHYDTAHGNPGADDNASGVSALIELARLLSKNNSLLKSRVQLVFYTLEEPPYFRSDKMGSYIHASHLKKKDQKIKVMIALDMVGYFSDERGSQSFPFPLMDKAYSDKGDFIAVVGNLENMGTVRQVKKSFKRASNLPVYSINAPAFIQGVDFSDHLNFWNFGYPAVLVTDTSFMRNRAYHTLQDTADRLDYEKMAEVVKALYQTVIDYSAHN